MGKKSRDKGKIGEREVAALLREAGYTEARRGCQYHGGADSPDVVGLPGIHPEVKRVEAFSLYPSLEQAQKDAGDNVPVVFHRRSRKPWVVVQLAEDWLRMYKKAEGSKDNE